MFRCVLSSHGIIRQIALFSSSKISFKIKSEEMSSSSEEPPIKSGSPLPWRCVSMQNLDRGGGFVVGTATQHTAVPWRCVSRDQKGIEESRLQRG